MPSPMSWMDSPGASRRYCMRFDYDLNTIEILDGTSRCVLASIMC